MIGYALLNEPFIGQVTDTFNTLQEILEIEKVFTKPLTKHGCQICDNGVLTLYNSLETLGPLYSLCTPLVKWL